MRPNQRFEWLFLKDNRNFWEKTSGLHWPWDTLRYICFLPLHCWEPFSRRAYPRCLRLGWETARPMVGHSPGWCCVGGHVPEGKSSSGWKKAGRPVTKKMFQTPDCVLPDGLNWLIPDISGNLNTHLVSTPWPSGLCDVVEGWWSWPSHASNTSGDWR